jgi:hypothetical protein
LEDDLADPEFDPSDFESLPTCESEGVWLCLPSAILVRGFGTRHVAHYYPMLIRVVFVLQWRQIPALACSLRCLRRTPLCIVGVRVLLIEYRKRYRLPPDVPGDTRYLQTLLIYRVELIFMINFVDLCAALLPLEVA